MTQFLKIASTHAICLPMIQVELSRIVISDINSQQVIFLREKGGGREFPIIIGLFEATSINHKVKGIQPPRPKTYDLLTSMVEALGGRFQDVLINRMQEQTFFAVIRLARGEELIEIDARPSDAIAVAVSNDPPLPIFIEEEILAKALAQKY